MNGAGAESASSEGRTAPRSFEAWYREVAARVTDRIAATVQDPVLGREAAAEAFARAYERWGTVSVMDRPEAWVHRVGVNVCRSVWRRRRLERRALARYVPTQLSTELVTSDHDVVAAVHALPRRMRLAVRLRYWEDMTERQVAERMAVAPGTASALLVAARRRMRRELGEDGSRVVETDGGPGGRP